MTEATTLDTIKVTLEAEADLLMHNVLLADPLNENARKLKAVSGKRNKTEADHAEMAKLEFFGGLYIDPKHGPYIPAEMIEACLVGGARKSSLGKKFLAAVFVREDAVLNYKGPRDADGLWEAKSKDGVRLFVDRRPVAVSTSTVIRTRPKFRNWSTEVEITFDTSEVNESHVLAALEAAGRCCALGDYRPKFGRFRVVRK